MDRDRIKHAAQDTLLFKVRPEGVAARRADDKLMPRMNAIRSDDRQSQAGASKTFKIARR